MIEERVFIAGAGPVGLVAAAQLVRKGIPVTVFEKGKDLSLESRASTFHPPTLDMLDEIGVEEALEERGLRASNLQYRSKKEGVLARFNFADIADQTKHPYRLQCEQWQLTRLIFEKFKNDPDFEMVFSHEVVDCNQDATGISVTLTDGMTTSTRNARWLIGADGASSNVRTALTIEFEGFTWPERFLVLSTPYAFDEVIQDLDAVSYVADPVQWHFLLRIPGLWRAMFPISANLSDEAALSPDYGQECLRGVVAKSPPFDIKHRTLYRVHQRVAKSFRKDRIFLAGDAAHINNPLGGMGMNGGIHDAVNLTEKLASVILHNEDELILDLYDSQRRTVTIEAVQKQTIQNKNDLEAYDDESQAAFRNKLRETQSDPDKTREFLERVSMIASLRQSSNIISPVQ